MPTERNPRPIALVKRTLPLLGLLILIATFTGCNRLNSYTLVSNDYGFAVTFPEKPIQSTDKNYQGFPKTLWTVYRNNFKEFYSAQATSYKEPLMTEDWVPGKEVGVMAGIQLTDAKRFKLRSAEGGREAQAIATTSAAPGGGIIATTYIIDGTKLISITARTADERNRAAFLESLKLLK